jgi:methionine-rich copper-binding protein CopC
MKRGVLTSIFFSLFIAFICVLPGKALAHAFPDHSDPRVGASVAASPAMVRIWFDSELEPAFSTISVQDEKGKRVDKGDGHVNTSDHTLLEAGLPALRPGSYRVYWSVVARDGHRTTGDYSFTVK